MRASRGRASAGFSIVELLIASAVLGIGLVGLVQLHGTAVKGVVDGEALSQATEIANQRAEFYATIDPEDVPTCVGIEGCRAPGGAAFRNPLSAVDATECTRWVDAGDVPDAAGQQQSAGTRYRVDTLMGAHPDPLRQPRATVLTVSVCWQDLRGLVHQVQTRRMLVPGA